MFKSFEIHIDKDIAPEDVGRRLQEYGYNRAEAVGEAGDWAQQGGIVDIFPFTYNDPVRIEFFGNKVVSIRSFDISSGETVEKHSIVVLLPLKYKKRRGVIDSAEARDEDYIFRDFGEEAPIDNFVDISVGDYVVHSKYGIGKYRGIESIRIKRDLTDHLILEYKDKEKLYVPCEDMHLVQKYIGFEGRAPRLYKLGSKMWEAMKHRTRKGVETLAKDLLEFNAKRAALEGFGFSKDTDWQREVEASFPYDETPDQLKSTADIKRDMESSHPMDRLLCGDVGYGKTEVALRAAFKAVMDNKQVAILVPTTILAEQHWSTFSKRLKDYPVNIQMFSRFNSPKEQRFVIEGLKKGECDIIIGTHRLLSPDVRFKDLGLVIIDEEQRFGVKSKQHLKNLRLLADVLTLTATPIPRTLYMALMGTRDMSVINTPPSNRLPIKTEVLEYDESIISEAVHRELKRGGQVYFIHNRIEGIERLRDKVAKAVPKAKIAIAHGRMGNRQLEEVMRKFINGKIDVLVSTTIVESGLDIPNVNTIIVNRADRFGLADLYQLRGRVGRFKKKAYAFFMIPKGIVLSGESKRRLRAIERWTQLGSGFKIAMEDLSIRGAGNLLGPEQHGYIVTVGFDLYCRLLREAVRGLKD